MNMLVPYARDIDEKLQRNRISGHFMERMDGYDDDRGCFGVYSGSKRKEGHLSSIGTLVVCSPSTPPVAKGQGLAAEPPTPSRPRGREPFGRERVDG